MAKKKSTKKQTTKNPANFNIGSEIDRLNISIKSPTFKSARQKEFHDLLVNNDTKMVICDGPAGTGKDFLTVYCGLKLLKRGDFEQILYIRSAADSSKIPIGFLPGDLEEKSCNYMEPLNEKLSQFLDPQDISKLRSSDAIESIINNYLRGRSINDVFVIVDEAQNFHREDLKTILTRFEENARVILIGDSTQSDIGKYNCYPQIFDTFSDSESKKFGVFTFRFYEEDIVRSPLCAFVHKKLSNSCS